MEREQLFNILMSDNVIESVYDNLDVVLTLIPELSNLIGFSQNHPHHHLDVWKHTLLALSFSPKEFDIRMVLLLHDIGKPNSYSDDEVRHFYGHEAVSADIANRILKRLDFERGERKKICHLIKRHDTPITRRKINKDDEMCIKKYKIQFCDALAHHPCYLDKRIEYLLEVGKELNLLHNLIETDDKNTSDTYDSNDIKQLVLTKNKSFK